MSLVVLIIAFSAQESPLGGDVLKGPAVRLRCLDLFGGFGLPRVRRFFDRFSGFTRIEVQKGQAFPRGKSSFFRGLCTSMFAAGRVDLFAGLAHPESGSGGFRSVHLPHMAMG